MEMNQRTRMASIRHPSHSRHVMPFTYGQFYQCDGCKEWGYGLRYRCIPCNFDLHESCARAPESTRHFLHPQHPLVFREQPVSSTVVCDLCNTPVSGFVYECRRCNFDLHPSCAKLPVTLQHALHPHHALHLQVEVQGPSAGICNLCGLTCIHGSYVYRCEASRSCDFYLHIPCSKEPVDPMEEMRMQSISPLSVPRGHVATATISSGTTSLKTATPQATSHSNALEIIRMVMEVVMKVAAIALEIFKEVVANAIVSILFGSN